MKEDAYVITGPTSGYGYQAARRLVGHGTLVLVGRNRTKLEAVGAQLEKMGGKVHLVTANLAEPDEVRRAAAEIRGLGLNVVGLVNNAGVREAQGATKNSLGWDTTFATNHLGPFLLTHELQPALADGARVLFVASAVEDPARQPAVAAGFRGGRYLSAQASARGEWAPEGSVKPGFDAYATSKQAILAAGLALAREWPRLRVAVIEPGLSPATALGGREAGLVQKVIVPVLVFLLKPFLSILTTPAQAGRVFARLITDPALASGTYFDERGRPMRGSALVHDPEFQNRVVAETRELLARS